MLINERIKLIMKANRMNAAQFADTIGVKPANLSHILSGRNKPSMDFLEKVLVTFENVNASWLITGQIKEEKSESREQMGNQSTERERVEHTPESDIEKIVVFYRDGSFKSYRSIEDHGTGN